MVRTRRGRRLTAGLAGLAMTAGLLAFTPAAHAATSEYTCAGADPTSQGLLDLIGSLAPEPVPAPVTLPLNVDVDLDYTTIEGSVLEPGEVFDLDANVAVKVPADLVDSIIDLGISAGTAENAIGSVLIDGATPSSIDNSADPFTITVPLVAGQELAVNIPAFGDTLTTTAPDGGAVDFSGGDITLTLKTGVPAPPYNAIFPGGVTLHLLCEADSAAPFHSISVDQPGPPKVTGSPELTVALGGNGSVRLPVQGNPAISDVFIVTDEGDCTTDCVTELGTASVAKVGNQWRVNYLHDIDAGDGVEEITFAAVNSWAGIEGNRTLGTLTVTVLGNVCEANPSCFLKQLIETTIVGDVMYMSQAGGEVTLEDPEGGPIVLDGSPQTAIGALNQVTVTNPRGDGSPWSLTGRVTDFTVEDFEGTCAATAPLTWDYRCIPGDNLAWNPSSAVAHTQIPGDVADVLDGAQILVADIMNSAASVVGQGLGSTQRSLCQAESFVSGGTFACGAGLSLVVPASASAGTYSAVLTLTLV